MKWADAIHGYLKDRFGQPSARDCRIWVAAALVAYFGALYLVDFFIPYNKIWGRLGVPAMTPIFADLRAVLAGFECTRQGYDVLYAMPCDPYNRGSLAYPSLWMKLEWLGLNLNHAIAVGIGFALVLYAATWRVAGKLNAYEAVVYVLLLCAPPVVLLVERANVDSLMYGMLVLCLLAIRSKRPQFRFFGYLMILVPSTLKLLPIFSIGVIVKERRRAWALFCFTLVSVLFLGYCYAIRHELKIFQAVYSYISWYSFGANILPHETLALFKALMAEGPLADKTRVPLALGVLLFIALYAAVLIGYGKRFRSWLNAPWQPGTDTEPGSEADLRLDAFRVAGCLFLCTFVLNNTFDYKLAFNILAVPQIIFWIRHDATRGRAASLCLVGLLTTLYVSPFLYRWLIDEMINWLLFGYFAYTLLATLPDGITGPVHKLLTARPARLAVQP